MAKDWTAPIYAFFKPTPIIEYVDDCHCHAFWCAAKACKLRTRLVCRFLDTGDAKSTSNLRKHAKKCWGADTIETADEAHHIDDVCEITATGVLQTSIMAAFE
jgi:hypothetical protein